MMKRTGIVTDSHSGISPDEANRLGIWMLPMPFFIGGECYMENVNLSKEVFFQRMINGEKVSTTQPAPQDVMDIWDRALEECEEIVYIPISSGLSGACSTATALALDEKYEGKVFVVDNGRVATPQHISILDALKMVENGRDGAYIKKALEATRENMNIYIGVDNLKYLKNGGRISGTAAFIGKVLNIKPILKFNVGLLEKYKESRGTKKMRSEMIAAIRNDMENNFKEWYDRGEVTLVAASSSSAEITASWIEEIRQNFPGFEVTCDELPMSLSCHIGPGGLGIAVSCNPTY